MSTLQQRQQIERQKFLKTKPQFQQNNPSTFEKIKYNIADVLGGGANFINYAAGTVGKFGSNLPADIIGAVSPKAANKLGEYTGGLLAGTSSEERKQYNSRDRLNRANIAAGAAASWVISWSVFTVASVSFPIPLMKGRAKINKATTAAAINKILPIDKDPRFICHLFIVYIA